MISSFSTKPIPISFYEYKKIMEQKLPKTFSDFLDIGYRTGLRSNFLCNLKKENVDLDKKVITGNDQRQAYQFMLCWMIDLFLFLNAA